MQFHSDFGFWLRTFSILPCIFQTSLSYHIRRRGLSLVVLPLGDSITFGTDSTDGNGYRLDLENLLEPANNLDYIGSVMSGSMADNSNEGHPRFTITQIAAEASQDFSKSPNIVLLMAGTNDVLQNLSLSDAPSRLGDLIDLLTTNLANSAILVATLTPLLNATAEAARQTFNAAIPGLIKERANAGKHVMMVDMGNVSTSEINATDGIHPDDAGYQTMAEAWYAGILEAAGNGLITNRSSTSSKISNTSSTSNTVGTTTTAASLAISLLPPSCTLSSLVVIGFIVFLGL